MKSTFKLAVTEQAGLLRASSPVVLWLPFRKGTLWDHSQICLSMSDKELSAQLVEVSRWDDGSLRWAHARTLLPIGAGERVWISVGTEGRASGENRIDQEPIVEGAGSRWQITDPVTLEAREALAGFRTHAVIVEKGGRNHTALSPDRVEVEEAGFLYASIFESGAFGDSSGQDGPFRWERRLHLWRGLPGVHIEYTFYAAGGDPVAELAEVRLETGGRGPVSAVETSTGTHPLNGDAFGLRQECIYEHEPVVEAGPGLQTHHFGKVDFSFCLQAGDALVRGEKHPGRFSFEAGGGAWSAGIRPFWETGPHEVSVEPDGRLVVYLVSPQDGLRLGRTRAITHELILVDGKERGRLVAELMHPLVVTVDPEHVGASGALPYVAPPREDLFPEYEDWFRQGYEAWRDKCAEYGTLHYGDWRIGAGSYRTSPSYFGDHEYDTIHIFLTQFARTGDPEYLQQGSIAARHYADVDIDQVTGKPRFHGYTEKADRHVEPYDMDWGHVFADGLVDHYLLTGDRRSLRAVLRVADVCASPTADPVEMLRGSERNIGLPLLALIRSYELTRNDKYLQAARRLEDFIADFTLNPTNYLRHGTWWRTWMHESSQTSLAAELLAAMGRYLDVAGDSRSREAFAVALEWYMEHTWDPERLGPIGQWNRYQRSHQHDPARISGGGGWMFSAFPYALGFKHSGDSRFIKVAWDMFEEDLRSSAPLSCSEDRGFTIPRFFAPHFLAIASELGDSASQARVLRTEVLSAPMDGPLRCTFKGQEAEAELHGQVQVEDSPWGPVVRTSELGWLSFPVEPDVLSRPGSVSFWIRLEDDYGRQAGADGKPEGLGVNGLFHGPPKSVKHNQQGLIYIASELPEEMERVLFRSALEIHIIYSSLWLKVYDWRGWITARTGASLDNFRPSDWHHVVGTWNNYNVTIHVDGEEVARQEEHCLPGGRQKRLYVGWRPMNWYGFCAWHDLRLHDSPLPPKRVREIFEQGKPCY